MLKKAFQAPLADARGSVSAAKSIDAIPSRDREGAVKAFFSILLAHF